MTNAELQMATFRLNADRPGNSEEENEWEWIVDRLDEESPVDYVALKSAIELEYAGRGTGFEVPSIALINEGLNSLITAKVVIAE